MDGSKQYKSIAGIPGGIQSWYLWLPSGITLEASVSGKVLPASVRDQRPDVGFLPARYRRKLSVHSAISLHVAYHTSNAYCDAVPLSAVFASRHGEGTVTVSLFDEIAADEMLSPLSFSRSVHNTASGLHSIVSDNRAAQTALAAGEATAAMGILEASMQAQASQQAVMVIITDESLHETYEPEVSEVALPFGLGILLSPDGTLPDFCIDESPTIAAGLELAHYLSHHFPEQQVQEEGE